MAKAFYPQQVSDSTLRPQQADTLPLQNGQDSLFFQNEDHAIGYFTNHPGDVLRIQSSALPSAPALVKIVPVQFQGPTILIPEWNISTNFLINNVLTRTVTRSGFYKSGESSLPAVGSLKPVNVLPRERNNQSIDWFLGFFLSITLLFIWIRMFYGKYFSLLANALISFQISTKLFRERNVLVRRVSLVLDFIYFMVVSIFTFEIITHFGLIKFDLSRLNLFLLLLNIIMMYSLIRIALLRLTGFLFLNQGLFSEYIHNTFVVNKGAGIVLFPVVITAHYFPHPVVSAVLVTGLFILAMAFIWKTIRVYQIIKRKDVVLFYLILYLCTLEILPLLLGYKFVISLI
jgi:hypothetical protein